MMTDNFQILIVLFYFFSNCSGKLQENSYVPEYSGISLILSIERVTPVELPTELFVFFFCVRVFGQHFLQHITYTHNRRQY